MSYIGPLTQELINACIKEMKKKETRHRINKYIIDPVLSEVVSRTYPYAISHAIMQVIIIILLIYIILQLRSTN
jgi:uncharacterized membrane protein